VKAPSFLASAGAAKVGVLAGVLGEGEGAAVL